MKQFWVKKFFLFVKRKVKNFSYHKAVVFVVCLALSAFLWLLNSLEKRYTSRIVVPVKYVEIPKDKQLSGVLPKNFDLIVDAYGYTLLSYKLRLAFSPILLSVSDLVDNTFDRGNKYRYTISTGNHKEEIEKQISSEIKILSIKPDSLVFNFNKIITKKVKIKPNLKLGFENQYYIENEPTTFPDSLLVSGPKNILDTIHALNTVFLEYGKLTHTIEKIAAIQPIKGLTTEVTEVKLVVPIEQNTEVSFDIPIQVVNNPSDIVLKLFPGKVKVTCRIGLSKYKKLDYSAFRAYVDYDKISEKELRLVVSFESHSSAVLSVNYSPKEVEYILEHEK
jgi:hypothetical protein